MDSIYYLLPNISQVKLPISAPGIHPSTKILAKKIIMQYKVILKNINFVLDHNIACSYSLVNKQSCWSKTITIKTLLGLTLL